jgi:hypothetical protein
MHRWTTAVVVPVAADVLECIRGNFGGDEEGGSCEIGREDETIPAELILGLDVRMVPTEELEADNLRARSQPSKSGPDSVESDKIVVVSQSERPLTASTFIDITHWVRK